MPSKLINTPERFWSLVDKDSHYSCWLWKGTIWRKHGMWYFRGRMDQAHRISWKIVNGEIPSGMWVLHGDNCSHPSCVRPSHLYLGTREDNLRDAINRKEMASGARNAMVSRPEIRQTGNKHWKVRAKLAAMRSK